MVETEQDRLEMLQDFGVSVVARQDTFDEIKFIAIFTNAYKEAGEWNQMASVNPVLFCRTSDIRTLDQNYTIAIGDNSYTIYNIEPDGTGFSRIRLLYA